MALVNVHSENFQGFLSFHTLEWWSEKDKKEPSFYLTLVVSSQLRVLKTLQRYSRILEHALLLQMSKPILEMRVLSNTVYF